MDKTVAFDRKTIRTTYIEVNVSSPGKSDTRRVGISLKKTRSTAGHGVFNVLGAAR